MTLPKIHTVQTIRLPLCLPCYFRCGCRREFVRWFCSRPRPRYRGSEGEPSAAIFVRFPQRDQGSRALPLYRVYPTSSVASYWRSWESGITRFVPHLPDLFKAVLCVTMCLFSSVDVSVASPSYVWVDCSAFVFPWRSHPLWCNQVSSAHNSSSLCSSWFPSRLYSGNGCRLEPSVGIHWAATTTPRNPRVEF